MWLPIGRIRNPRLLRVRRREDRRRDRGVDVLGDREEESCAKREGGLGRMFRKGGRNGIGSEGLGSILNGCPVELRGRRGRTQVRVGDGPFAE